MLNNELNNNPFKVPENYFDALPRKVQDRYSVKSKKTRFTPKPRWAVAGVLGIAVLIVVNISYMSPTRTGVTQAVVDFVTNDSATPYEKVRIPDQGKSGIINEGMINYLALENISIDDILNARF